MSTTHPRASSWPRRWHACVAAAAAVWRWRWRCDGATPQPHVRIALQLLGLSVETRPRIMAAMWHYAATHKLHDAAEHGVRSARVVRRTILTCAHTPQTIVCDAALRDVFGLERIPLAVLPALLSQHQSAPDPIEIRCVCATTTTTAVLTVRPACGGQLPHPLWRARRADRAKVRLQRDALRRRCPPPVLRRSYELQLELDDDGIAAALIPPASTHLVSCRVCICVRARRVSQCVCVYDTDERVCAHRGAAGGTRLANQSAPPSSRLHVGVCCGARRHTDGAARLAEPRLSPAVRRCVLRVAQ